MQRSNPVPYCSRLPARNVVGTQANILIAVLLLTNIFGLISTFLMLYGLLKTTKKFTNI